ncbi:hypothetical protein L218DRAFT_557587 [Marasmius fiardii PR-910]|nr:hypothetical protein L218DRAFT_557587 [Marasmius fiardii PR-910]
MAVGRRLHRFYSSRGSTKRGSGIHRFYLLQERFLFTGPTYYLVITVASTTPLHLTTVLNNIPRYPSFRLSNSKLLHHRCRLFFSSKPTDAHDIPLHPVATPGTLFSVINAPTLRAGKCGIYCDEVGSSSATGARARVLTDLTIVTVTITVTVTGIVERQDLPFPGVYFELPLFPLHPISHASFGQ